MRRLSTAAMAMPARARGASRLRSLFKREPIGKLMEMRAIKGVQQFLERMPANAVAQHLAGDEYSAWLHSFRVSNDLSASSALVKADFERLVKETVEFLQTIEQEVLPENPRILVARSEDEEEGEERIQQDSEEALVEAIQLKLSKHKCKLVADKFALLDKDHDGSVAFEDAEGVLRSLAQGKDEDWAQTLFRLHDSDSDGKITQAECKQILDSIARAQAVVLGEIFAEYVDHMPKKQAKLFQAGVNEANYSEKVLEQMRCVYHFARRDLDTPFPLTTLSWESFRDSQQAEMPKLFRLLEVYAKGYYDDRWRGHEHQREKQSTRRYGLLLAVALGVGDVVFALL